MRLMANLISIRLITKFLLICNSKESFKKTFNKRFFSHFFKMEDHAEWGRGEEEIETLIILLKNQPTQSYKNQNYSNFCKLKLLYLLDYIHSHPKFLFEIGSITSKCCHQECCYWLHQVGSQTLYYTVITLAPLFSCFSA